MADKTHVDAVTGTATTGHVWDGIRELNTPLPRWWLWLFYITIVWAIGYWIVYPAWPLVSTFTTGTFGWNSRTAVVTDLNELKTLRAPMTTKLAATALGDIKNDQALADFAYAQGRSSFRENCGPCHGAGGGGAKGYLDRILQKICEAVNCEIGNIVSVILLADAHCEEIANIGKSAAVFGLHRFLSAAVVGGDDEVLGSMEMYCCMPRRPCLNEIRVIERATCLAAIAIKRHQAAATASDTLEVCPD